jgi:hypothetical protein
MVTRELQVLPLMSYDFSKNRYDDSLPLLMGTNEVLLVLKTFFFPILQKFGTETFQNKVLINTKFCENRCWEKHNLLRP